MLWKVRHMNFREYTCNRYIIKQGDTLYSISRENNVPLPLILRLNPFVDIYNLQVGDELCIPVLEQDAPERVVPYVVQNNDSLQTVLDKFGIELNDLMSHNNLSQMMLLPGTTIMVPNYED